MILPLQREDRRPAGFGLFAFSRLRPLIHFGRCEVKHKKKLTLRAHQFPHDFVPVFGIPVHQGTDLHEEQLSSNLPRMLLSFLGGTPDKGMDIAFLAGPHNQCFLLPIDQDLDIVRFRELPDARGIDADLALIEDDGGLLQMRKKLTADNLKAGIIELDFFSVN